MDDSERLYNLSGEVKTVASLVESLGDKLTEHIRIVEKHIDTDQDFQREVLAAVAENTRITSTLKVKVAGISAGIASVGTLAITFIWNQLFK